MKPFVLPVSIFVVLMGAYVWTMAPGNFWADSAAFAACNEILGLPHSPSFPLYTILGRVVNWASPFSPVTASNLYSAVATAGAGVVFFLIVNLLLASANSPARLIQWLATTATLFTFLTLPIWQSAVRTEVYALQLLLSLLALYFFLKAIQSPETSPKIRLALAAVFFQGLSFANHPLLALVTFPLIPALPLFLERSIGRTRVFQFIGSSVALFVLAAGLYLYLPIRANQDPAINSGRPTTFSQTVAAVTRSDSGFMPPASPAKTDYIGRASRLALFVFDQTGTLVLMGLAAAIFFVIRERHRAAMALLAVAGIGLAVTLWAAEFELRNFDIVAYAGLPVAVLCLFGFLGLFRLATHFQRHRFSGRITAFILAVLVILQFTGNLGAADLSRTKGPDRLAQAILAEAPTGAILLVNQDELLLPLWYHCHALGERPDLAVVSSGALYRPSYREELRIRYPGLKFPPEFASYRINDLGKAIQAFCAANQSTRPILTQFGVPGITADQLHLNRFLFRYGEVAGATAFDEKPVLALLDTVSGGATDLLTRDFVGRSAFNYGVYLDRLGQTKSAYHCFQYAIAADDQNPEYLLRLGLAFLNSGRTQQGIMLLQQAIKTGDGSAEAEAILAKYKQEAR